MTDSKPYVKLILMVSLSVIGLSICGTVLAAPPALKVSGLHVTDLDGHRVHLKGVNAASMEWTSNGEGHILDTVRTAVTGWHANVIRLPLSQDRWFGKAPEQKDDGAAYRALVRQVVDLCDSLNSYVMLDLHWSNAGDWGKQIGQHLMPDVNSLAFWKECAAAYANRSCVMFDLYNETHDVSWQVWKDGGDVVETDRRKGTSLKYTAIGMQKLLDTVRATGAKNVVVAGGLDWAYDMSGFLNGSQLVDPTGSGVIYANHDYPFKGDTFDKWLTKMKAATAKIPVIVSEFGSGGSGRNNLQGDSWIKQVVQALHDNDWDWTAWDMHPSAAPSLISDWNYTPTADFGVVVKQELATPPVKSGQ